MDFPKDRLKELFDSTKKKTEIIESVDEKDIPLIEEPVKIDIIVKVEESKEVVPEVIDDKKEFDSMNLSESDLMEIKKLALKDIIESDLSVSELIDLVLLAKKGNKVKEKNFENLVIREYIDYDGKITKNGRMFLEFDETKERLRKLLK